MLFKKRVLSRADENRVVAAIGTAEQGHRGEIRVHLEARYPGDGPLERAEALFGELGMHDTKDGTGVLLYVAYEDHKVAVYAGPGVYGAAEPGFWKEVTDTVATGFRTGDRAGGLERGLALIGGVLKQAAPGEDEAGDELPNAVSIS